MTEKEWELIRRFKSLVEQRLQVIKMVVFGSRARGDAGPESDLDVLVIINEPETFESLMFIYDCGYEAGMDDGVLISPTVYSRLRWENSPERSGPLAQAIREEGIAV